MSQATRPLLLFGSADNFDTAWTKVNAATVATGVADPFGEANAYTINDASAAATRYVQKAITLEAGVTRLSLWFILKAGTATDNIINWRDTSASVDRRTVKITWAGGVPTLTNITGSATLDLVPGLVGSGYYAIRIGVASIVAANTNVLQVMPAATTTADTASVGTLTILRRSLVQFTRPLDDPSGFTVARAGSGLREISSGVRDAWNLGNAQRLVGMARFIPPSAWDAPAEGTGWEGRGEDIATNVGFDALFRAASDAILMRWVPDRADAATFVDCYLEPLSGKPDTERRVLSAATGLIALRAVPISLVSYGDIPFEGY